MVGCASGGSPSVEVFSALLSDALGSAKSTAIPSKPNPAFRYLRVEVEGRPPALLVLGYLDADPQGEIEVWYSAKREVIKTQNGRIVGTAGLELDWRQLRFTSPPPAWDAIPPEGATYSRSRDVSPGYRYGILEQVELRPVPAVPPLQLPSAVPAGFAGSVRWYRESVIGGRAPLPPAWFAWGAHDGQPTVVYSEQCLAEGFCLKLLRWPLPESVL